jgi:hypothetical protein
MDRAVACLDEAMRAQPDADAPTPEALDKARELLNSVSFWVDSVPEPATVFSLDGGVQVAWKNDDLHLHLRLFCAPEQSKSYIYISYTMDDKTAGSAMMPSVDVFTLADSLHWLQTCEWPTPPWSHPATRIDFRP